MRAPVLAPPALDGPNVASSIPSLTKPLIPSSIREPKRYRHRRTTAESRVPVKAIRPPSIENSSGVLARNGFGRSLGNDTDDVMARFEDAVESTVKDIPQTPPSSSKVVSEPVVVGLGIMAEDELVGLEQTDWNEANSTDDGTISHARTLPIKIVHRHSTLDSPDDLLIKYKKLYSPLPPRAAKRPSRLPFPHDVPLSTFPPIGKGVQKIKRIYPRPTDLDLDHLSGSLEKDKAIVHRSPLTSVEELDHNTPDLSLLPGAFVFSPELPTAFSDFVHSPLPSPSGTERFARIRRDGSSGVPTNTPLSGALSPTLSAAIQQPATPSSACSTTFPTTVRVSSVVSPALSPSFSAIATLSPSLIPTSTLGTPTLLASPRFSQTVNEVDDVSAPSTPIPDGHSSTMVVAQASAPVGSNGTEAILFDAAIASTIVGAVLCVGTLGWLAVAFLKRRGGRNTTPLPALPAVEKAAPYDDDNDDNDDRLSEKVSTPVELPQPPPLARLPFEPYRGGGDDETFQTAFDGWVPDPTSTGSTEDHGGYPEEVARADGLSNHERRLSIASRTSMDTFSTRRHSRQRSSLRASTPCSVAESTFSRQSARSSKTSHYVSPTPPRLPSPIDFHGDDDDFFCIPSKEMTRRRSATTELQPPVPDVPDDFKDQVETTSPRPRRARTRSSSNKSGMSSRSMPSIAQPKPLVSCLKTSRSRSASSASQVNCNSSSPVPEEQVSTKLRKLEKRRATVDGTFEDVKTIQAFLFQNDTESSAKTASATNSSDSDPFTSASTVAEQPETPKLSGTKKWRPVTMPELPPAIVVSNHPQELVPPPTPSKLRTSLKAEAKDTDVDTTDEEQTTMNRRRRAPVHLSTHRRRSFKSDQPSATTLGQDDEDISPESVERHYVVSSFPSPPTLSSPSMVNSSDLGEQRLEPVLARFSKSSVELDVDKFYNLERIESTESLLALARSKTLDTVATTRSLSSSSIFQEAIDRNEEFLPSSPLPTLPSSPGPPPRPPRSMARDSSESLSSVTTSRIPILSRLSTLSSNSGVAPWNLPTSTSRSFAADLQASIGRPPSGYESDTLLSYGSHSRTGFMGSSKSSFFLSHNSSVESLEDVAITKAETVHIGGKVDLTGPLGGSTLDDNDDNESENSNYDDNEVDDNWAFAK